MRTVKKTVTFAGKWVVQILTVWVVTARIQPHLGELLPTVSCDAVGQVAEQRWGYPDPPLDFHQEFPGAAVCSAAHHHAVLHLRCYWHAGRSRTSQTSYWLTQGSLGGYQYHLKVLSNKNWISVGCMQIIVGSPITYLFSTSWVPLLCCKQQ